MARRKSKGAADLRFGEIVRDLRTERGMTQAQLAEPEFSKGFISLLETGRTGASMRAIEIISRKLGVRPATLIGDDPGYGRLVDQLRAADRLLAQIERFVAEQRPLVKDALAKYEAWARGQKDLAQKL